jgi:peptidoglycan/LPS O-acetylase OafA/YrhL
VEEQFYLLWPWLVWKLNSRQLKIASGVLIGTALLLRCVMLHYIPDQSSRVVMMNTFARMDSLIVGGFCAIAVREPRLCRFLVSAAVPVMLLALFGIYWIDERCGEVFSRGHYTQSYGYSLVALLFGGFVLLAYRNNQSGNLFDRALRVKWLRMIGKYSYGIYVYHVMIFIGIQLYFEKTPWYGRWLGHSVAACALAVLASFVVAFLSYELFEKRLLRLKNRFPGRSSVSRNEHQAPHALTPA